MATSTLGGKKTSKCAVSPSILRGPDWGLLLSCNSCVHGLWGEISWTISKVLSERKALCISQKWPLIAVNCCESVRPLQGSKSPKSGKEGFGSKNSHFPVSQKWARWDKKSPFSLWSPVKKWGFFVSKRPFLGHWEMGVFWPRNPLFPILAILTPVGGGRFRNN